MKLATAPLGMRALGMRALGMRALGMRALGARAFGARAFGVRALAARAATPGDDHSGAARAANPSANTVLRFSMMTSRWTTRGTQRSPPSEVRERDCDKT